MMLTVSGRYLSCEKKFSVSSYKIEDEWDKTIILLNERGYYDILREGKNFPTNIVIFKNFKCGRQTWYFLDFIVKKEKYSGLYLPNTIAKKFDCKLFKEHFYNDIIKMRGGILEIISNNCFVFKGNKKLLFAEINNIHTNIFERDYDAVIINFNKKNLNGKDENAISELLTKLNDKCIFVITGGYCKEEKFETIINRGKNKIIRTYDGVLNI